MKKDLITKDMLSFMTVLALAAVVVGYSAPLPLLYNLPMPNYDIIERAGDEFNLTMAFMSSKAVVLYGEKGAGKTSIVVKFALDLRQHGYDIIYINNKTNDINEEFNKISSILRLPNISEKFNVTMTILFDYYRDKKVLFIFEDALPNQELWDNIIKHAEDTSILILITSRDPDWEMFPMVKIEPFNSLEIFPYILTPEIRAQVKDLLDFRRDNIVPLTDDVNAPRLKYEDADIKKILEIPEEKKPTDEFIDPYEQNFPEPNVDEQVEKHIRSRLLWEKSRMTEEEMHELLDKDKEDKEVPSLNFILKFENVSADNLVMLN